MVRIRTSGYIAREKKDEYNRVVDVDGKVRWMVSVAIITAGTKAKRLPGKGKQRRCKKLLVASIK